MADHGVLTTGFVRKTEDECFSEIIAEARATIQSDLDDSEDTVHGAQAAIVSTKQAELWEVAEDTYNSFSENAEGDALDRVCALTGTTRKRASYSIVTATVNINPGTYAIGAIVASVSGDANARFSNTSAVTNPGASAAPYSVPMQAISTGPTRAPAGTLTVLENPPAGVNSITNPADADLGSERESDGDLRIRRRQELYGAGSTTVGATQARLIKTNDVSEAHVYTNRNDEPDDEGRPGHCMEAVVLGGADDDIAATIWGSIAAGIESFSFTGDFGEVVDEEGNVQPVPFTRPTEMQLFVRLTLAVDPATYAGNAKVQETISDFTDGVLVLESSSGNVITGNVRIGGVVYGSKLSAAAQSVAGVLSVTSVEISDDPGFASPVSNWGLMVRQYLGAGGQRGISSDDVTVITA